MYSNFQNNIAVEPDEFLLEDSYIYFNGYYRTWTFEDTEPNYEDEGREVCYTDGTVEFGDI